MHATDLDAEGLIKHLNSRKGWHGHQYRALCGDWLRKRYQKPDHKPKNTMFDIQADLYEETCGAILVSRGVMLRAKNGRELCRFTDPSRDDLRLAALWANAPRLLDWAREACEVTRAWYDRHEDLEPPSWLAELEETVRACARVELEMKNEPEN